MLTKKNSLNNMAILKFEQFIAESVINEEMHLVVTDDTEDEDSYGTKYSFKKGDKLVVLDNKDGEFEVKHNGKKVFIDDEDIKSFTKKAA